jgi:preprotein translocase subunit SecF
MKKIIFGLMAVLFIIISVIISCNTPEQKVEKAEKNVKEANKKLDVANANYMKDIEVYRIETGKRIAENTKSIEDFNIRIATQKQAAKDKYERKMAELSQKNTDMKKRLEEYTSDGDEKWQVFKNEFNAEMYALGNSLRTLTNNK